MQVRTLNESYEVDDSDVIRKGGKVKSAVLARSGRLLMDSEVVMDIAGMAVAEVGNLMRQDELWRELMKVASESAYGMTFGQWQTKCREIASRYDENIAQIKGLPSDPVAPLPTAPQLLTNRDFELIRKDFRKDNEGSWSWIVVLSYKGNLETDPGEGSQKNPCLSEDQINAILEFAEKASGLRVMTAGSSGPGQPFASEPWIQIYPQTLIVSQDGGRDI